MDYLSLTCNQIINLPILSIDLFLLYYDYFHVVSILVNCWIAQDNNSDYY